jgi:endonuclease III
VPADETSTQLVRRARKIDRVLAETYPDAKCELDFGNAFELLVVTVLSAQTTDKRVNATRPTLFAAYPDATAMAAADRDKLEQILGPLGFFRQKTQTLLKLSAALVEHFDGEVPRRLDDLVTLPGVGRKTANVLRSVAMDLPGLPVDTHVGRLSRRLELTTETDPVKAELALNGMVPAKERGVFSLRLILHGRAVCVARKPRCGECVLADFCPSAFRA